MAVFKTWRRWILGAPRDPFSAKTRSGIALVAFMAWIGLGADGLSSSAYGPEQAFLALGSHHNMAFYIAVATSITVFIIALAYNQVIELFPNGGGGYKVAMKLIGPYAAVISGSALIVDYVLTIAVSIASAIDALLSFLPTSVLPYSLDLKILATLFLLYLNLRGIKESIRILMPIFLFFVVAHVLVIAYGIGLKAPMLPLVVPNVVEATKTLSHSMGWFFVISLLLRAYSLGGGTYTGIEAVSNNVGQLAEPRIRTGKWTMFYMAASLSFTAGGILLLYLLWDVQAVVGQTLNAVVFGKILTGDPYHHTALILILLSEGGLLFVAANTGFMGGPAVLANMALDKWCPKSFYNLSSRLVTQNGVLLFGLASVVILMVTDGNVATLVVHYSINVFITFSLSLLGICIYWWGRRRISSNWIGRLLFSIIGLVVCSSILLTTVLEKFTEGGWMTLLITGGVVSICLVIRRYYRAMGRLIHALDVELRPSLGNASTKTERLHVGLPTAVFFVGESIGEAMYVLSWVQQMFPKHFKNFIFIGSGVVDVGSYGSEEALQELSAETEERLNTLVQFMSEQGYAARSSSLFGTDLVGNLIKMAKKTRQEFSKAIFFGPIIVLKKENWITRHLHSKITEIMLRRLMDLQIQMIPVPVKLKGG